MDSVSFLVQLFLGLAVLTTTATAAVAKETKAFKLYEPEYVEVTEVKASEHSIYLRSLKIFLFLLAFAY